MCVIFICDTYRPTSEEVEKAYNSNKDGAGIAYRGTKEVGGKTVKLVHWRKGLDLEQIQKEVSEAPLPFIAHFRIASCGGPYKDLCHPFPIHPDVPLVLKGSTPGYVLFHNGHHTPWKDNMKSLALNGGGKIKIPTGHWSDTRAMALMAAHLGNGYLEFLNEKLVAFGPESYEIFEGAGFFKIQEGFWASNRSWEFRHDSRLPAHYVDNSGSLRCLVGNCNKYRYKTTKYCFEHKGYGSSCNRDGCHKVQEPNSSFCKEHKEDSNSNMQMKCVQGGCEHMALPGTVFCYPHEQLRKANITDTNHKVLCIIDGCKSEIVYGATILYCEEHLGTGPEEVAPEVRRFPKGTDAKKEGEHVETGVEGGKETVEYLPSKDRDKSSVRSTEGEQGSNYGSLRTLVALDPMQIDQFLWARSLNPKDFHAGRRSVSDGFIEGTVVD